MLRSPGLSRLIPRSLPHSLARSLASRPVNSGAPCFVEAGRERQLSIMVENLRSLVLAPPANCERFHVVFLDRNRAFLGESGFGTGQLGALSLNLRELFSHGLALEARNMIIAHNHPSGDCRPSAYDIDATQRLANVAQALEIGLIDHLIFADKSVYSMRAGGEL